MKTPAVGVCLVQILGKFSAIGFDIRHVLRLLALGDLLFALGLSNEAVEFVLTLGGVDVDAAETTWVAG